MLPIFNYEDQCFIKLSRESWALIFLLTKTDISLLCTCNTWNFLFLIEFFLSFTLHNFWKCFYWFTFSFIFKSSHQFMFLSIDSFIWTVNSKINIGAKVLVKHYYIEILYLCSIQLMVSIFIILINFIITTFVSSITQRAKLYSKSTIWRQTTVWNFL